MSVPGKESDNGVVEFQFYRPEAETKWQSFRKAIYDPSSKRILGRTPKSWGQLLLFYSIFYIVLAALFFVCMRVLFSTLDKKEPTWILEKSLIGVNPGLGYRPMAKNTEEGSLIWYNITNSNSSEKWVSLVDEFLKPYKEQKGLNNIICDFDRYPKNGEVCAVKLDDLGNCNSDRNYGYGTNSPCIFLKLNRIFGWVPEYYTSATEDMPQDLQDHINNTKNEQGKETPQIWVSCNGLDDVDRSFLRGFNYHPRGFAGYYYPYRNDPNYLSPFVAVEILTVETNRIICIECRAWAKNIQYIGGSLNREGSVTFEIQVDTKTSS